MEFYNIHKSLWMPDKLSNFFKSLFFSFRALNAFLHFDNMQVKQYRTDGFLYFEFQAVWLQLKQTYIKAIDINDSMEKKAVLL